jgi:hypothetical protein
VIVAEFIGVAVMWVSKWYKSGKSDRTRCIGFSMAIVISIYWMGYFALNGMPWLALNSVGTMGFSIRGLFNNADKG